MEAQGENKENQVILDIQIPTDIDFLQISLIQMIEILEGYTKALNIFMNKLAKINPGKSMSDEIEYWEIMIGNLNPAKELLEKEPNDKIILSVDTLVGKIKECVEYAIQNFDDPTDLKITQEEHKLVTSYEQYQKQRNRMIKGFKEASWNNKYMNIIKGQVKKVEDWESLWKVACSVTPLMSSLKNIYENSNFYKEARIISFIDHLFMQLEENIKITLSKSRESEEDEDEFEDNWEYSIKLLDDFLEGFFLDSMIETNRENQVNTMDFLNFIRPDTRATDSETMYGRSQSGVSTPHIFSPSTAQVKWDDVFSPDKAMKTSKLKTKTINPFSYSMSKEVIPKAVNPSEIMKDNLKKGKTHRLDLKNKSSKLLLWFDRGKRILNDAENLRVWVQEQCSRRI